MPAERDTPDTTDPLDEAMAWHDRDTRATIEAPLQDRMHLAGADDRKSLHVQGLYARLDARSRIRPVMKFMAASSIPDFTVELVRAANEVGRLQADEVRNLIFRAIAFVRELREEVGIPGSCTRHDAVVGLHAVAVNLEEHTPSEWSAALLEAADLIRTLRIVLDSGVGIALSPSF